MPANSLKSEKNAAVLKRNELGSNTVEFTYCLVFVFFVLLLPFSNYGTFMSRWAISSQTVNAWTQNMAKKRRLSDAFKAVQGDEFANAVAHPTGIKVKSVIPVLSISKVDDGTRSLTVETPGKVPSIWLPDAGNYEYTLRVNVVAQIDPLVTVQLFGLKVPGLTEPADVKMSGSAMWENKGRDPGTTEFYLNE
jgi:hypothetical protein